MNLTLGTGQSLVNLTLNTGELEKREGVERLCGWKEDENAREEGEREREKERGRDG